MNTEQLKKYTAAEKELAATKSDKTATTNCLISTLLDKFIYLTQSIKVIENFYKTNNTP